MIQHMGYIIILSCLIATFFLYNEQLASIPLLILSAFFFYQGLKEMSKIKNNK